MSLPITRHSTFSIAFRPARVFTSNMSPWDKHLYVIVDLVAIGEEMVVSLLDCPHSGKMIPSMTITNSCPMGRDISQSKNQYKQLTQSHTRRQGLRTDAIKFLSLQTKYSLNFPHPSRGYSQWQPQTVARREGKCRAPGNNQFYIHKTGNFRRYMYKILRARNHFRDNSAQSLSRSCLCTQLAFGELAKSSREGARSPPIMRSTY